MTVFNLEDSPGVWFDHEEGGRIKLRSISADKWKEIRKQTVKKKVDYKKIEGSPVRLEFEEVNEDLQNELFWDEVIVDWEKFFDGHDNEIPCTKENKIFLMMRSMKFAKYVNECLKTLSEDEEKQNEVIEKN